MPRAALAILISLFAATAGAQSIFTYAGGGTLDGRNVNDIPTYAPRGVAIDKGGNVYLSLRNSGYVVKVDAGTGIVTTVAGNGAAGFSGDGGRATDAALKQPEGIALDADGNLFIADSGNFRIRRVDAKSGVITTFAGGGTPQSGFGDGGKATEAELTQPACIAISHGSLYLTDSGYNTDNVRRVNLSTGIIDTIAGSTDGSGPGFAGDNGPAKDARFKTPYGIVADADGNLFINDVENSRIRKISTNGIITTYAGGGTSDADGVPATDASLDVTISSAIDNDGNLLIYTKGVIRRIDKTTQKITTVISDYTGYSYGIAVAADGTIYYSDDSFGGVKRFPPGASQPVVFAGGGSYTGDGLIATAAVLHSPQGLAVDSDGNLLIADAQANVIRRVAASDRIITTVAGKLGRVYSENQEGQDALGSAIGYPVDIAFDAAGNYAIADPLNGRIWRVDTAGKITTYAGGGDPPDGFGDKGAATSARILPWAMAFDRSGNLYIADNDRYATPPHARIRRVDAATKVITTIAGTSDIGFDGDNGPATSAKLDSPIGVAVDNAGNVYISDSYYGALRRVDPAGTITTIAGHHDDSAPVGDGGPAAQARLSPMHLLFNQRTNELFVADRSTHRIRKINAQGTISTIAGSADSFFDQGDFAGDNGPATAAKLSFDYGDTSGIAISPQGDLFFSDSSNNRVRAVLACTNVVAPQTSSPSNNATAVTTSPRLTWSAAAGAFRYDVVLDTNPSPSTVVASDIAETSITLANLQPNSKYYWKVVAKGDRFCATTSSASSSIASFTTSGTCAAGPFGLISPADNTIGVSPNNAVVTWSASNGAATYDLYYGTITPPPLLATGITQTAYPAPVLFGMIRWFVVAHAACDPTETATTPIRSFLFAGLDANCLPPPSVTATAPAPNTSGLPATVDLRWSSSGSGNSIAVYFGTTNPPPLLRDGLSPDAQSLTVSSLAAGTTYYWRVAMTTVCAQTPVTTAVQSFTTRADCPAPGATSIVFAPPSVSSGATYAIVWSPATGLGGDGGYLVERSTSSSFDTVLDSQVVSSTAASFLAGTPGTIYHRVRALPACDPTKGGPISNAQPVTVTAAPPNVIFSVPPQAIVTALGERLEDQRNSFTLENIGSSAVQVIVGRQELGGSPPFFSIEGDAAFVTLQPHAPKTFTIRYSGPPNNVAGSYQGVIFFVATGQSTLAVTPYAFVNLKVGGGAASIPQILVDGNPSEYAAFPGFAGDDANRPPRQIAIRNGGSTPMELAAEIAPEVWLVPDAGWNASALEPGETRTVNLRTQRVRAPNGSALPRYTYFTVRTKDGTSSRLLVQDNDQLAVTQGRSVALDVNARSFVIPEVARHLANNGAALVTRMRLTNLGGDAVQAELIYTPMGADGSDASAVRSAAVVIPPNDVVTITDPISQIFGALREGQIEVRIPRERVGLISVRSSIVALNGAAGFDTPVVARGEGARVGAPHVIYLLPSSKIDLVLAETSGNDAANVRVVLFDDNGNKTTVSQPVARYGMQLLPNLTANRVEIDVDSGGGSVIALATIANAGGDAGATVVSRPLSGSTAGAALLRAMQQPHADDATPSITTVVPMIVSATSSGASPSYATSLGLIAVSGANFTAIFRDAAPNSIGIVRNVSVGAGSTKLYGDVLKELFGLTSRSGSVFVQGPPDAKVYAVLLTASAATATPAPTSYLTLPTSTSEALSGGTGSTQRPLYFDGLEQSVDPTRGSRWLLVMNEVSGASGTINVRLYEAANRTSPVALKDFAIGPYQQLTLDTIFSQLGLDAPDRRKDRTNVEIVVTATSGSARIAATAIAIDNRSGDTKTFALTPAVGSGTPNVQFVTPSVVTSTPAPPVKHRAAKH